MFCQIDKGEWRVQIYLLELSDESILNYYVNIIFVQTQGNVNCRDVYLGSRTVRMKIIIQILPALGEIFFRNSRLYFYQQNFNHFEVTIL